MAGEFKPIRVGQVLELRSNTGTVKSGGSLFGISRVKDPIDISFFDINTGEILLEDSIFRLESSVEFAGPDEDGELLWDTNMGIFSVNAFNADFSIAIDSPLVIQQGMLSLSIRGGSVVRSDATGIFSGLFPGVGTPGNFSVPLGMISLDVITNSPALNGRDIGMSINSSTIGEAFTSEVIPEPSTLVLLSIGSLAIISYRWCRGRRVANTSRVHC